MIAIRGDFLLELHVEGKHYSDSLSRAIGEYMMYMLILMSSLGISHIPKKPPSLPLIVSRSFTPKAVKRLPSDIVQYEEWEQWLTIAYQDLRAAQVLADQGLFDPALYHTQQCAEKAFKGFLVFNRQPIKKVHDLVLLLRDCKAVDKRCAKLMQSAKNLKPYSVKNRYPDEIKGGSKKEMKQALDDACFIFDSIEKIVLEV